MCSRHPCLRTICSSQPALTPPSAPACGESKNERTVDLACLHSGDSDGRRFAMTLEVERVVARCQKPAAQRDERHVRFAQERLEYFAQAHRAVIALRNGHLERD